MSEIILHPEEISKMTSCICENPVPKLEIWVTPFITPTIIYTCICGKKYKVMKSQYFKYAIFEEVSEDE